MSEIDKYNLSIVDFSSKLERYIYSAIYGLYFNGASNITPIDIENYLKSDATASKVFEKENGITYLQDILDIVQVENFPYYYSKLKKINLLNDLKKSGFDTSDFYVEDYFNPHCYVGKPNISVIAINGQQPYYEMKKMAQQSSTIKTFLQNNYKVIDDTDYMGFLPLLNELIVKLGL